MSGPALRLLRINAGWLCLNGVELSPESLAVRCPVACMYVPAVFGRLLAWGPGSAMPGSSVCCCVWSSLGSGSLLCDARLVCIMLCLLCLVVSRLGCSLVVCGRLFLLGNAARLSCLHTIALC
jgi:hypothetical protein